MKPVENQAASYLEWCEYVKRMTPATILTKRKALERFIRVNPTLTDFVLLTNHQFDSWRASLARDGKSAKTINNYADHISCCVKWLKIYCKQNVLLDLDLIERAEETEADATIYTPAEVARAIAAAQGPRDDLILSLAFQSGLRLTEMATLKVENIEGLAIKVLGKKRHRRRTFIREDTREKLDKWLALNQITEGYIFPSPIRWGGYLSPQQIRDSIKLAFKRAGIDKHNHPHALRHTWFTTMLDNGAPLMDTAMMGGHTDPRTTSRYYHASPKRHGEIHKNFIPTVNQLTTGIETTEDRHQEMY